MFTEFHGFPRPSPKFNLFYLEPGEFLITSIPSSLRCADLESTFKCSSEGKLHLCTRSLIFQPDFIKSPLLKLKLSNPDMSYSFKFPSISMAHSPNSKTRKSINDRSASPFTKSEVLSVFTVSVPRCTLMPRYPSSPGFSFKLEDTLEFRMNQTNLLKLSTELDMVGRSAEEKHVAQIIFGVRYKELVSMLINTEDFNPDDILLNHKCKRIIPEGEQWGALVLTQNSLHFYVLMNPKPKAALHIAFQDVSLCSRYKYQSKATGLRFDLFSSHWPLVFILETEEQREGMLKFIMNKVKFRNPIDLLAEFTDQWVYGRLSNFEYLMVCNSLGNRTSVDFSQYPVFPWVISRYQGSSLNLNETNCFRDLGKHVGELESSRLQRLTVRLT